tara:strand:- start:1227 stop:1394 length:168 start_codon:yes stop_codon:yes gene_type:complete
MSSCLQNHEGVINTSKVIRAGSISERYPAKTTINQKKSVSIFHDLEFTKKKSETE